MACRRGRNRFGVLGVGHSVRIAVTALVVSVLALGVLSAVSTVGASAHPAVARPSAGPPNDPAYNWVELHRDNNLTGVASNSSLSTSNVGSLGVRWARSMYGSALSSPVVTNTSLGMMTYIGTTDGYVLAFKVDSAQLVWSRPLGGDDLASPVVSDGALWMASENPAKLYKFNLTTGATECSLVTPKQFYSSFTAATPPGGKPSIYVSNLDNGVASGPIMGIAASNCAVEWSFSSYQTVTGPWSPIAYGIDKKGTPLVLDGSSSPDDSEYALNALTGKEVWHFQAPADGDYDIAAGATISPPGVNGFADGVAYVPSKYGTLYAVNLTTGAKLWSYKFDNPPPFTASDTGRSTAALDGTNLVVGHLGGVIDLNAITGALRWKYNDPTDTEVISSVAIAGSATKAVVLCADLGGAVHALSLANGDVLYNYQTGGYIVSSPAVTDGNVLIASSDGLLYDFAVGGGDDTALPTAAITSPGFGSSVPNPDGREVLSGTASDPVAVNSVDVAIESSGIGGTWWNGATGTWQTSPVPNSATLASPGEPTTDWSFALPVPKDGGSYLVSVTAHSSSGQASTGSDQLQFVVLKATTGPRVECAQFDVAAGGKLSVSGAGFTPGETVSISLRGVQLRTVKAGSTGSFGSIKVPLPEYASFGESSLLAIGLTSKSSATAPIYITNSWDDPGNDQGNTGFAPNDFSYGNIFFIGENSGVDPAWDAIAGSAITTSAAVAGGVAYIGDASGQVLAIDAHTGVLEWTWQDPSGEAIDGAPTVDPAHSLVMVSTADGTVTALTTAGTRAWSTTVAGVPHAPTFGSGEIYIASNDGSVGSVTALVESSGALSWSHSLASPATDAVALDTGSGLMIVGQNSGAVTALSTSSGSVAWTFTAGGAVKVSPMITGGSVYVGSANGTVYALSESTGASRWTHSTGSPITASPVDDVTNNLLFVGSDNGRVTALSSSTGRVDSTVRYGSPIVGIANVHSAVFVTCANGNVEALRPYGLKVWDFNTGGSITTAPVIVDGAVYVGNSSGSFYAFTPYGDAPL